jgi:dTDP-4-dehydrorhamnose reductase
VRLDITDREAVLRVTRELEPTVVIHAAAVNPGQGDHEAMWRVNVDGSRHAAEAARDVGSRLVAISTDVVHDGRHGPYLDDAPANPINEYGRSKAAAEEVVGTAVPEAAIVRTSLMYGFDEMDRGTAGFVRRIEHGEPVVLFSDVVRNPILVDTLAEATILLAETAYSGTLNIAGREAVTRDEYGRGMLAYWGVSTEGLVRSGSAAERSGSIPLDLRLSVVRAERMLGVDLAGLTTNLSSHPRSGLRSDNT